jgi:hypothetical protein
MNRKRLFLLLLCVVILLPGCFVIWGFSWSNYHIPKGGKAVARLVVRPGEGEGMRGYFWVLIHFVDENDGPPEVKVGFPRKFDTNGNFGGPHDLVRDDDLEVLAREHEACMIFGGFFSEDTRNSRWFLVRTEQPIRSRGAIEKAARTLIGIEDRVKDGSTVAAVHFYTGFWRDDGDPEGPDGGDTLFCTSALESQIPIGSGVLPTETGTSTTLKELTE